MNTKKISQNPSNYASLSSNKEKDISYPKRVGSFKTSCGDKGVYQIFTELPNEIWKSIIEHLTSNQDFLNIRATSHRFFNLCTTNDFIKRNLFLSLGNYQFSPSETEEIQKRSLPPNLSEGAKKDLFQRMLTAMAKADIKEKKGKYLTNKTIPSLPIKIPLQLDLMGSPSYSVIEELIEELQNAERHQASIAAFLQKLFQTPNDLPHIFRINLTSEKYPSTLYSELKLFPYEQRKSITEFQLLKTVNSSMNFAEISQIFPAIQKLFFESCTEDNQNIESALNIVPKAITASVAFPNLTELQLVTDFNMPFYNVSTGRPNLIQINPKIKKLDTTFYPVSLENLHAIAQCKELMILSLSYYFLFRIIPEGINALVDYDSMKIKLKTLEKLQNLKVLKIDAFDRDYNKIKIPYLKMDLFIESFQSLIESISTLHTIELSSHIFDVTGDNNLNDFKIKLRKMKGTLQKKCNRSINIKMHDRLRPIYRS